MSFLSKEQIRQMIKEKNLKTSEDIQDTLKEMFADTLQEMLEAELEHNLGYEKHDVKNKSTTNSRNGHSKKTVRSDYGEIDINVPRDRNGEFEPVIVPKHQRNITGIESQIISMYAKGMTTRDIQDHLGQLYQIDVSPTMISNVTQKLLPLIQEWQNRPLSNVYAIVYLDAIHYKVRQDGAVVNKAAYMVIGINLEGYKDVLGIWIGENESSKFWMSVCNDLRNRGVEDILIASVDNLKGFSEAIQASFPQTEIQKCIVHQIRNSTKFVSYKDLKKVTSDLKPIYKAINEETALEELNRFEKEWGAKYPIIVRSWRNNWDELSTFFKYPAEIRKLIYTTNIIESFHRQLRKVTKGKSIFPNDEALQKILYLATMDILKKWTGRVQHWGLIISQLAIYFEDRIEPHLK